jgi:hypothetical protein
VKWLLLGFIILTAVLLTLWLRGNPNRGPKVWILLGALPFLVERPIFGSYDLYMALVSWPTWPGFAKGIEISLVDAVAVAVLLSRLPLKRPVPCKTVFFAYLLTVIITSALSSVWVAGSFYVWQLIRSFLLFSAVVSICDDERSPHAILSGVVLGYCVQVVLSAYHYVTGSTPVLIAFGHQNLLGLMSHFVIFPSLALLLAKNSGLASIVGPGVGASAVALTASRASIGLAGAGFLLLLALSAARRATARKAGVALVGLALLAVAAPLAISSLEQRFLAAPLVSSYDERAAFEKAAMLMLADHPGGVGPNQYVIVANTAGYSDRGGVVPAEGSRSTNVHNFYLLIAAESGWAGLALVIIGLVGLIRIALRTAFKFRDDSRGDLLLGLVVAVIMVALHSLYEWILISFYAQYMLAITAGLIVGIAQQMNQFSRSNSMRVVRVQAPEKEPLVAQH